MKNLIFTLLLITSCFSHTFAQQTPLSQSRKNSDYTHVYRLSNEQLAKLIKNDFKDFDESYLTEFVATIPNYKQQQESAPLSKGTYVYVSARDGNIYYRIKQDMTAEPFIAMPNGKFELLLKDTETGDFVTDAQVYANKKHLKYDSKTGLYNGSLKKKDNLLRIHYKGVDNYYSVNQEDVKQPRNYSYNKKRKRSFKDYFNQYIYYPVKQLFEDKDESDYRKYRDFMNKHTGYMVFDKPKYRPNDTVNVKTWITDRKGNPIKDKELLVRVDDEDEPLGIAKAYRDGGFTFSFQLVDSLNLYLDSDYDISFERLPKSSEALEETNDDEYLRRIFIRNRFHYEDYELRDVNFFARCNPHFHRGDSIELFLQAKDENDLTIPDGRVDVSVSINKVGTVINERDFIPNLLWSTDAYQLDSEGETKVTIPAHLFPMADVDCSVEIDFLNTDNQWDSKKLSFKYIYLNEYMKAAVKDNDLVFSYFKDGQEASADVSLITNTTTIAEWERVRLPFRTPLNTEAVSYVFRTNTLYQTFENEPYFPVPQVGYSRTADSLFISIGNEKNLPYWYTLYVNGKVKESGRGETSIQLNKKLKTDKLATFKLNYELGGRLKSMSHDIYAPGNKALDVKIDAPHFVSPGQTFDVEALVTDMHNKPQSDVDLTAFAPTSKFKEEGRIFVPYFGKEVERKPLKSKSFGLREESSSGYFSDFSHWVKELNLTQSEYYKFLHTPNIYTNTETIAPDKAEIAPFVVKNGKILPVHILYIDEEPVFFSKATQLNRYSFEVKPERTYKISMRTDECIVTLNEITTIKGKKLIVSVNADNKGRFNNLNIVAAPDTLSNREMDYMSNFMQPVENTFGKNYAWIEDSQRIYFLNTKAYETSSKTILAGPLRRERLLKFNLYNLFSMDFPLERNYTYRFEPNLLRQTSIKGNYSFSNRLKDEVPVNFSDTVFHKKELDDWYENLINLLMYSDVASARNSYNSSEPRVRLRIETLKKDMPENQLINSVIIYPYDNPKKFYQLGGKYLSYENIPFEGECRIVFLLKNKQFFSLEDVELKKYGLNVVKTGEIVPQPVEFDSIVNKFYYDTCRKHRTAVEAEFKSSGVKTSPLQMVYDPAIFNHGISGNVSEESGEPLIGVSIVVKGTDVGTITDIDGNFYLNAPLDAVLVFNYLGFKPVEAEINAQESINVVMQESSQLLEETVVIGYGAVKKSAMTASVASIASSEVALSGQVAGISIRGTGSTTDAKPLIIVDGLPYTGSLDDLDTESIMQLNVLKDAAATAIYGSAAANGVIIITTNKLKADKEENADEPANFDDVSVSLRKNFKDVAFWQPMLRTDKKGKAKFSVTMPDDISRWNAHFIAMGKNAKTGYTKMDIKSFKSLTATLALPRFAITDDSIQAIGKISNYMGIEQELQRRISINGEEKSTEEFTVNNYRADTIAIHATNVDTMNVVYSFVQRNGYSDGEERHIPVFPQGTKETEGLFYVLESDSSFVFQPKPDGSEVTFHAEGSPLPDMLKEIDHIRDYEYLCNEQLASKLKALLMEKRIRIHLNVSFDGDENILYIIKKLTETRLSDGYWGWWPGSERQIWISRHIIEALYLARQTGYQVNVDFQTYINDIMLRFPNQSVRDQINSLQLLIMLDARPDYEKLIAETEQKIKAEKITNQTFLFELMHIKQQKGIQIDTEELLKTKRKNMFGAVYWGEEKSRSLFFNSTKETLLAYRILKADTINNHENTLKNIRHYFFQLRKDGNWRNIYESSLILETILPDLLKESGGKLKATKVKYSAVKDSIITTFPVSLNSPPTQSVKVEKEGTAPVYVTTYQQYWNKTPEKVEKEFIVHTYFQNSEEERVTELKAGQPVTLVAEVTAIADAEYVMIEIPIPAGCSYYEDAKNSYNRYDYYRTETHREQFKNKTAIFCERLKEGKHTFKVELMPRFAGKYSLNPAKAEMMYFPVFFGREEMKKVEIR